MSNEFDPNKAAIARDQAIALVEQGASSDWKHVVYQTALKVIREKEWFTTDDIWQAMPADAPQTQDTRALGAVMRRLVKDGHIEPTTIFSQSVRVACHRRPLRVWRRRSHNKGE